MHTLHKCFSGQIVLLPRCEFIVISEDEFLHHFVEVFEGFIEVFKVDLAAYQIDRASYFADWPLVRLFH